MYLNEGEKSKGEGGEGRKNERGQERSEKERKKGELYIIRWSLQISTKTKREAKKRGEKERKCPVMMTCLHNAHQRLLSFIHCHVQHQTQVHKIFCKW